MAKNYKVLGDSMSPERRNDDMRHQVELIISLPNGEFLRVRKPSATEDGLIRVIGVDIKGVLHERFIAPEVIQCEVATVRLPPPLCADTEFQCGIGSSAIG